MGTYAPFPPPEQNKPFPNYALMLINKTIKSKAKFFHLPIINNFNQKLVLGLNINVFL